MLNTMSYDPETDTLVIGAVNPKYVARIEIKQEVYLLIGADGKIVGVEISQLDDCLQGVSA